MAGKDVAEGLGIGLFVGAVVGVALGIIYAPHSGRITRGIIDEKTHEATRRAERIVEEAKDTAENIVKEARSKIKEKTGR